MRELRLDIRSFRFSGMMYEDEDETGEFDSVMIGKESVLARIHGSDTMKRNWNFLFKSQLITGATYLYKEEESKVTNPYSYSCNSLETD